MEIYLLYVAFIISLTFFRIGYIESWGRGTLKIVKECMEAGLPKPDFSYDMSGFFVVLKKDVYYEQYLIELGLNARQIKGVLYAKENGR
jgi:ATP-dependent DNA helicase RecG